jgi:hypothetical protein
MMCKIPRNLLLIVIAGACCHLAAQQRSSISWASYVTGDWSDAVRAVAVDRDGGVWVAGASSSSLAISGPNQPYQAERKGKADAFLAKLVPEAGGGTRVAFWTWFGGTGDEQVNAMALDSRGRVYLTGSTDSTDLPRAGEAFQNQNGGEKDAFVAIFDPALPGEFSLAFSSYYGGAKAEVATALAVQPDGAVVVAGTTLSEELPGVQGNLQGVIRGGTDAFVIRFDPSIRNALRYATYFGGTSSDYVTGVAVDRDSVIWITGYTFSNDFPLTANGFQTSMRSSSDGFLAAINPRRTGLDAHVYGSYFGGSDFEVPQQLAIDSSGQFWISGYTFSKDFPITADAVQSTNRGFANAFLTRLDLSRPAGQAVVYSTYLGGGFAEILYGMALLGDGRVALAGYTMSTDFPTAGKPAQGGLWTSFADAFIAVLNTRSPGTAGLEYSTYFGGNYTDIAYGVAMDATGNLVAAGVTTSSDLPVTDGTSRSKPTPLNSGFVVKIAPR